MKINANGFTLETLQGYLQSWQERLKGTFGDDFVIKKEGVVDNIATASSLSCMDLESQIAYLLKQQNPYTAEGLWQDKLYSLIGLTRTQATHTVVSRTCEGTPSTSIPAGELIIENASTRDQFRNNDIINFDENGRALGSFTAEESGAIDLPADATINIVTPFTNLTGVYHEASNNISIGVDYESDEDFRKRWQITSSSASANTQDGLYKALLSLVDSSSDLKIFSNRTGSAVDGIPAHCQKIVLNSPYDNETIAQTIFDNLVDGNMVGLQGTQAVDITDSQGSTETIRFDRASVQDVYIRAEVTLKSGVALATVSELIKANILEFIGGQNFAMGTKLLANMFIAPIYEIDDVVEVSEIKVSTNGTTWADYVQLGDITVPSFASSRITVNETD